MREFTIGEFSLPLSFFFFIVEIEIITNSKASELSPTEKLNIIYTFIYGWQNTAMTHVLSET